MNIAIFIFHFILSTSPTWAVNYIAVTAIVLGVFIIIALVISNSKKKDLIRRQANAINDLQGFINHQHEFINSQQNFIENLKGLSEAERQYIEKQNQVIRNGFGDTKEMELRKN